MSALTAKLDLDPSGLKRGATQASRSIADVRKDLQDLNDSIVIAEDQEILIEAKANIEKAEADLKELKADVEAVDAIDPEIGVKAHTAEAQADFERLMATGEAFSADLYEVTAIVDDDDAEQALRDLGRKLDDVDATVATPDVVVDAGKAESRVRSVHNNLDELDSFVAEPEIEVPDAEQAGGLGGMEFAKGAIGSIGAAGIATAIVTVFNEGMDRIQVRERITQQFGLVKDDVERLTGEATDIYASGWGDSTGDVLGSLAQINRALVETGVVSEAEAAGMAEDAIVLADVFGKDVSEVIRAVSQLLKNGLAPDAQTAMDILATGMQQGADDADDLFDSIDEYAQHFGAFGLGAEEMMALFTHGMANGQRDTDKLADAVKEMRLIMSATGEATDKVYTDLGLSADTLRDKINRGGPEAREAFGMIITALADVEDETERTRLGIAVMGPMYEDLTGKALDSFVAMGDGLGDTTGKIDEMNEAMSDTQSEWEIFTRDAKEGLGELAEGFAEVVNWSTETGAAAGVLANDWSTAADSILGKNTELKGSLIDNNGVLDEMKLKAAGVATGTNDLGKEMQSAELEIVRAEVATDDLAGTSQAATDAAEDLTEEMNRETQAARDLINQIDDLINKKMRLVGSSGDVTRAEIAAREAVTELDVAMADATLTTDEKTIAMLDATDAQIASADAIANAEIAQREANGETVSAATAADIQAEALHRVTGTLEPGSMLQQGLLDMADNIDNIPNETAVQITSNAAEEDRLVEQLDRRIRNLQDRTITIRTNYTSFGSSTPRAGGRAKGGPVGRGETYWVGEEGPELVTFPQNGYVLTAPQSAAIAGSPSADTARMLASASVAPFTGSSGAAGVATGGGGVTLVNSKASVTVADVAMAIRLARG